MYVARLHLGDHDGKSKEISACSPNCAHYITLFSIMRAPFGKLLTTARCSLNGWRELRRQERDVLSWRWVPVMISQTQKQTQTQTGACDDKPDTRPVNVTAGCSTALPQSVDKASKHGRQQTYLGTIKSAEKLVGSSSGKASSKTWILNIYFFLFNSKLSKVPRVQKWNILVRLLHLLVYCSGVPGLSVVRIKCSRTLSESLKQKFWISPSRSGLRPLKAWKLFGVWTQSGVPGLGCSWNSDSDVPGVRVSNHGTNCFRFKPAQQSSSSSQT